MKSTTHQALAWGLVYKDPKGFLISTQFRGASSHFRFDHFYIVDFHSTFSRGRAERRPSENLQCSNGQNGSG